MKRHIIIISIVATLCTFVYGGGPYRHDGDGGGITEWFHRRVHSVDTYPELYLVCIYAVRVQPHGIPELAARGWEEYAISSTVVDIVRGEKKIGDRYEFRRYFEGKAADPKGLDGKLWYIFLVESPGGQRFVCPQEPGVLYDYSEDLQKVIDLHRPGKESNKTQ